MNKVQKNKSYYQQTILFLLTSKAIVLLFLFSSLISDAKNQQINPNKLPTQLEKNTLTFSKTDISFSSIEFDEFVDSLDEFFENPHFNYLSNKTIFVTDIFAKKCKIQNYCKIPFYILFQQLKLDVLLS